MRWLHSPRVLSTRHTVVLTHSLPIPLSLGGGTYFFDSEQLWSPPVGAALFFNGLRLHGGRLLYLLLLLHHACMYSDDEHYIVRDDEY